MNLSNNLTLEQATYSALAEKYGIDNLLNPENEEHIPIIDAMKVVAENIYEPIIARYGQDNIVLLSFYRCNTLNKLVSDDPLYHPFGKAIDLKNVGTMREMFKWIMDTISYNELIWVGASKQEPRFMHVVIDGTERKDTFRMPQPGTKIPFDIDLSEA